MNKKIKFGQYFTKANPFINVVFEDWFNEAMRFSNNNVVLEPFVGNEDLIKLLNKKYVFKYHGYDIDPKNKNTIKRNTLKRYPKNYDVAITNPPYLARNSATRKNIPWIYDGFDDLYKVSLNKMLENNNYVAAIIPATLITSGLFKDRLSDYILLNFQMFDDTNTPVCLSLFKPNNSNDFRIWELYDEDNIRFINTHNTIKNDLDYILARKKDRVIKFNKKNGKYGVLATDKSIKSIKFVKGIEIPNEKVKLTSRNMVRFSIDENISINDLNNKLQDFFNIEGEVFLAPFKNLRKDGKYRRRLDFNIIKRLVQSC